MIARLHRLADRLPELGADGEALAAALERWLAPGGPQHTLEDALGIPAGARTRWWLARRNEAIRLLADDLLPGAPALRQAKLASSSLTRYAAARWLRIDWYRPSAPAGYTGRDRHLFDILHANRGRVPSEGTIRRALGGDCSNKPVVLSSRLVQGRGNHPIRKSR